MRPRNLDRFSHRRAFTLIEVLVVVATIGLLVAILVPSLSRAREQARRAACASNQKQLMAAVHMYASKYGGYVPFSVPYFNASLTWIVWQEFYRPYGWVHLGLLYGDRQITDPKVFYCPSNNQFPHVYPEGWRRFSAGGGIEQKSTGYIYAIAGQIDRYRKGERTNVRLDDLNREALSSCIFLGKVDKRQPARLWPHKGGVNGGFADGSAQLHVVRPSIALTAGELYQNNAIDPMDYFAFCFFKMLSGDRRWIEAFPYRPEGIQ